MSRLTRKGKAEPVSRDQILKRERGQGNINFPCSADHEQDWQPFPVVSYSAEGADRRCMAYIDLYTYMATRSVSVAYNDVLLPDLLELLNTMQRSSGNPTESRVYFLCYL